jgi:hypothetical protein
VQEGINFPQVCWFARFSISLIVNSKMFYSSSLYLNDTKALFPKQCIVLIVSRTLPLVPYLMLVVFISAFSEALFQLKIR